MKSVLVLLSILIAMPSFAEDLCKILPSEYSEGTASSLYKKHFWDKPSFNEWEKRQVMAYINYEDEGMEYYDKDGNTVTLDTFADVFNHFSDSSGYDELLLEVFKDKETGYIYTYVWSYPGDNEYGVYVDNFGNVIAEIQDGGLVVGDKYCP